MTATSDPSGQAVPDATIQYQFQITDGDAYTDRDWNATTTAPLGTTLSPQGQTCGSGGGWCSQSSIGDQVDLADPRRHRPEGRHDDHHQSGSDQQNVVVEVPDCDKRGKKVRCEAPLEGRGGIAQAGRGDPHRSASQDGEPGRALAATGDNEVRAIKAALACVFAGSLLVALARSAGRRSGRVSLGDTLY